MLLGKLVKFQMCIPFPPLSLSVSLSVVPAESLSAYNKHHCEIVTFDGKIKPKKRQKRKLTQPPLFPPPPSAREKLAFDYTRLAAN